MNEFSGSNSITSAISGLEQADSDPRNNNQSVDGTNNPLGSSKARQKRHNPSHPNPSKLSALAVSERLMLWVNDSVLNELLKQYHWDFKLVEEVGCLVVLIVTTKFYTKIFSRISQGIPLNSPKLPEETRDLYV